MYSKFSKINKDDDLPSRGNTKAEHELSDYEKRRALERRMAASREQFAISTESFEKSGKRFDQTLTNIDK